MDQRNRGTRVDDDGGEEVLDPGRAICDAHHHLWDEYEPPYLLEDFRRDTGDGHRVVSSVFVEVGTHYRPDGPEHLRPVGETEWVAGQWTGDGLLAGIVGFADLRLGPGVEEVLAAHRDAGDGRFRGIRHSVAWDDDPRFWRGRVDDSATLELPAFAAGVEAVAAAGLSFETWCFFHQLPQLARFVASVPDVPLLIDHLGGPLGTGRYGGTTADVVACLRAELARLARFETVHLKLGGIGMTIFGSGWDTAEGPVSSEEVARAWGELIRWCIDTFGPRRCMFESNFPVDRVSIPYRTLWNAFKRMASGYTDAERDELFAGTATRFYRLPTSDTPTGI